MSSVLPACQQVRAAKVPDHYTSTREGERHREQEEKGPFLTFLGDMEAHPQRCVDDAGGHGLDAETDSGQRIELHDSNTFVKHVSGTLLQSNLNLTGPHAFGPKKIYFGHKILMKQPHDCSY